MTDPAPSNETPAAPSQPPQAAAASAPARLDVAKLRAEQNAGMALAAGIAAALAGAALWAAVTVTTHYELGLMSVVVGVMVGKAVRATGQGIDPVFGYIGGACALFGSLIGAVLSDVGILAAHQDLPYAEVLHRLSPDYAMNLYTTLFQPLDLLFYGIAVYEAYKFSFKYRLVRSTPPAPPPS